MIPGTVEHGVADELTDGQRNPLTEVVRARHTPNDELLTRQTTGLRHRRWLPAQLDRPSPIQ
ncbi:hypothetical protein [Streptomyces sp. GSL17-111]|uniref:hypothetical protein n=1 Tax=Streptomyces sp. GSL17-111 TaxID=3121596 RepID=UPI0030F3FA67